MLIIPAIHMSDGLCTRTATGEAGTEGKYPFDPALLARLWRVENAKSLHLVDVDCLQNRRPLRADMVRTVVDAVDIPVQLAGGFRTVEDVQFAFVECAVYRIVLDTQASANEEFVETLVEKFGPRRIVITIRFQDDARAEAADDATAEADLENALRAASRCRLLGVQRAIVSGNTHAADSPHLEMLYRFADSAGLSITVDGGVRDYRDLKKLQDLHPAKIDSIIIGEALYSNSFPCQKIWRLAEKELIARERLL